jgi:hypothetical protein
MKKGTVAAYLVVVSMVSWTCGDSTEPPRPTSISVNPSEVTFDALGAARQASAQVLDQNGQPVPNEPISWSSDDAQVASVDSTGLIAAVGNGTTEISAGSGTLSGSITVRVAQVAADLQKLGGDAQTGPVGGALNEELAVQVLDRLDIPIAGVSVAFAVGSGGGSVDPANATTNSQGRAAATWTLGAAAGLNTAEASVTGLAPVSFSATGVAGSVVVNEGDGQTGLVGFAVNVAPSVRILDANDNPIAGEPVTFAITGGGGSVTGATPTTDAQGIAAVGKWTLGATPGTNTLEAATAFGTVTFTAAGVTSSYDVEVRFLSTGSPSLEQAFLDAADRWEVLLIGDLTDIPISVSAGSCGSGSPALNETIDDLVIFATIDSIDGPGNTLGQAGPCFIRSSNQLPLVGRMIFDEADLADLEAAGLLDDVIVHEMGHVVGFGTLWDILGFLADPALSGGTDPHFTGPRAIEAFDSIGGAGYSGSKVPVEDNGGPGTADAHWRESVLGNELMTGFLNLGSNPLSEVSIASLWDLGYQVNLDGSDSFSITSPPLAVGAAATISLGDDILRLPIYVFDEGGQVVKVIESR